MMQRQELIKPMREAINANDVPSVLDLIRQGFDELLAIKCIIDEGQFSLLEDLTGKERFSFLRYFIVECALVSGYLANETLMLQVLLSFKSEEVRKAFANEVHRRKSPNGSVISVHGDTMKTFYLNYDPRLLLDDANTIAVSEEKDEVLSNHRGVLFTPEVQVLFFRYADLLPFAICSRIATFIYPVNEKEAKHLFSKMPLEIKKVDLTLDLRACHLSSSKFALFRVSRPLSFMKTCQKASSEEELEQKIQAEVSSKEYFYWAPKTKKAYRELLEDYSSRSLKK